jgi:hypothetical protein
VKRQTAQLDTLTKQLSAAQSQEQAMAVKAIEGAAGMKSTVGQWTEGQQVSRLLLKMQSDSCYRIDGGFETNSGDSVLCSQQVWDMCLTWKRDQHILGT